MVSRTVYARSKHPTSSTEAISQDFEQLHAKRLDICRVFFPFLAEKKSRDGRKTSVSCCVLWNSFLETEQGASLVSWARVARHSSVIVWSLCSLNSISIAAWKLTRSSPGISSGRPIRVPLTTRYKARIDSREGCIVARSSNCPSSLAIPAGRGQQVGKGEESMVMHISA